MMLRKDWFCTSLPPDEDSPVAEQHDGVLLASLSDIRSANGQHSPAMLPAALLAVAALTACVAQLVTGSHRRHQDNLAVIAFYVTGKAGSLPINLCAADGKQR